MSEQAANGAIAQWLASIGVERIFRSVPHNSYFIETDENAITLLSDPDVLARIALECGVVSSWNFDENAQDQGE